MLTVAQRAHLKTLLSQAGIAYSEEDWSNFDHTVKKDNALIVRPNSMKQVQDLMRIIYEMQQGLDENAQGIKVHAIAGSSVPKKPQKLGCCARFTRFVTSFFVPPKKDGYDASYSLTGVAGNEAIDVFVAFPPDFSPIKKPGQAPQRIVVDSNNGSVEAAANVTIGELEDALAPYGYTMSTSSMTAHVTLGGLIATGEHGTGEKKPSIAGLVEELEICDAFGHKRILRDGELRTYLHELGQLYEDAHFKDFEAIRAAHLGMFGVITRVKLKNLLKTKNMRETIRTFANATQVGEYLKRGALNNHRYTTVTAMLPKDPEGKRAMYRVAHWEPTDELVTDRITYSPVYDEGLMHALQELEIRLGTSILSLVIQHKDLYYAFLRLMQAFEIGPEGTHVRPAREITHYQGAFPRRRLQDISTIYPVDQEISEETLSQIYLHSEQLIDAAAERGEYPVSYALYTRYFSGTNGGLSTSATTGNHQRVTAFEMVGDPNVPGFTAYRDEMIRYMREDLKLNVRFHPGKYIPAGETYENSNPEGVKAFKEVLERWHVDPKTGEKLSVKHNPFVTPYDQYMLGYPDVPKPTPVPEVSPSEPLTQEHVGVLQQYIMALLSKMQDSSNQHLFNEFNGQCNSSIERLNQSRTMQAAY